MHLDMGSAVKLRNALLATDNIWSAIELLTNETGAECGKHLETLLCKETAPKATPEPACPQFTCPDCGSHRLEEVMDDVTMTTEILSVGPGGDLEYGDNSAGDSGTVDRYQCLNCGHVIPDATDSQELAVALGVDEAEEEEELTPEEVEALKANLSAETRQRTEALKRKLAQKTKHELDGGGSLELDTEDGTIRYYDAHGNCENVWRVGEADWKEQAGHFNVKAEDFEDEDDEEECEHPNAVLSDSNPPATWHCPDCGENFIMEDEEEEEYEEGDDCPECGDTLKPHKVGDEDCLICDGCGETFDKAKDNACPDCGAEMDTTGRGCIECNPENFK